MYNKKVHMITFILLVIGGLNWLLEGVFMWGISDLVGDSIAQIIYILVGIAAIYEVIIHKKCCRACSKNDGGGAGAPPAQGQM